MENFLIVGLGNPGILYENTRHNIGFKVVKALGKKYNLEFKKDKKLNSKIAFGKILNKEVLLLLPLTYMNNSGQAVRNCLDYYKVDIKNILVVVDDTEISFEEFRLKKDSSSGGHNGLKSIEHFLKTNSYKRLRIGVGRSGVELSKFVLQRFSKDEKPKLKNIIEKSIEIIEGFLTEGFEKTSNIGNIKLNKFKEEKNE
ncbi:MAG: aminoacyl-tRNA hydrolase [Chlamydiae bacterium RIFCSPHIGHO2_12_FULL_27_8]|nr:MAG: aminoacyl-tRNA hydrolase [Chlamydiae bacterium RIFCSPHIGHO2_12_FULL_27_8]